MVDYVEDYQVALNEVRKRYVLPADSSVESFLTEHRALTRILLDARPRLEQYFGAETTFSLKAPIDWEGEQTLYAVVLWPGEAREVRNALAKFDDEWLARSTFSSIDLTFTYELV
jgi:hypothetical protein